MQRALIVRNVEANLRGKIFTAIRKERDWCATSAATRDLDYCLTKEATGAVFRPRPCSIGPSLPPSAQRHTRQPLTPPLPSRQLSLSLSLSLSLYSTLFAHRVSLFLSICSIVVANSRSFEFFALLSRACQMVRRCHAVATCVLRCSKPKRAAAKKKELEKRFAIEVWMCCAKAN